MAGGQGEILNWIFPSRAWRDPWNHIQIDIAYGTGQICPKLYTDIPEKFMLIFKYFDQEPMAKEVTQATIDVVAEQLLCKTKQMAWSKYRCIPKHMHPTFNTNPLHAHIVNLCVRNRMQLWEATLGSTFHGCLQI